MKLTTGEIISYIAGAGGLAGGLIAWMRGRKQDKASTIKTIAEAGEIDSKTALNISEAAHKLLDRVERQYKELEDRYKKLEDRYKDLDDRFIAIELKFDTEQEKCLKEIDALKSLISQLTVGK